MWKEGKGNCLHRKSLLGGLMILKRFKTKDGRKVVLRTFEKKDLKRAKDFCNYINSIVEEDDFILVDVKQMPKQEREWIERNLKSLKRREAFHVVAESDERIVGIAEVSSKPYRMKHVGSFDIAIVKDFRGVGLGGELMETTLELGTKKLKIKPKVLQLEVFETNKRAIALYKKFGFKEVARIPKEINRRGKFIDDIIMQK